MRLPRDEHDVYNQCASGPTQDFVGLVSLICRLQLTTFDGPTAVLVEGSQ